MKCPKCGGNGKEYWNGNVFCNTGFECDKCNGTGEIEMTNEEWLHTLSTEEKAKVLYRKAHENYMRGINGKLPIMSKDWEMWLKQPHKGD